MALPVLLRFSDMLRSRIEALSTAFDAAIDEFGYTGGYTTVYPIKVNQLRRVVEEIVAVRVLHWRRPRVRHRSRSCRPCWRCAEATDHRSSATATRTRSSCASR